MCIFNALRARRFIHKHRLVLEKAAHHGGLGIVLPDRDQKGIPNGYGFEFPLLPLIFTLGLIGLAWWTRQYE